MNKDKIFTRLARLEQALKKLADIYSTGLERFSTDTFLQDVADRNLQVGIQCCIDIGNYLIAIHGWRMPESAADVFIVMAQQKVIPLDLAEQLGKAAGLRNIIVHEYMDIDREREFVALTKLDIFRSFARYIIDWWK